MKPCENMRYLLRCDTTTRITHSDFSVINNNLDMMFAIEIGPRNRMQGVLDKVDDNHSK